MTARWSEISPNGFFWVSLRSHEKPVASQVSSGCGLLLSQSCRSALRTARIRYRLVFGSAPRAATAWPGATNLRTPKPHEAPFVASSCSYIVVRPGARQEPLLVVASLFLCGKACIGSQQIPACRLETARLNGFGTAPRRQLGAAEA